MLFRAAERDQICATQMLPALAKRWIPKGMTDTGEIVPTAVFEGEDRLPQLVKMLTLSIPWCIPVMHRLNYTRPNRESIYTGLAIYPPQYPL